MTRIRPCIDLHQGQVKQIVGSTLNDSEDKDSKTSSSALATNFCSDQPPSYYADLYRKDNLTGGHVIMLGRNDANTQAAKNALQAWPYGLQVGGGITNENCQEWVGLSFGDDNKDANASKEGPYASHVIVTSHVFREGKIEYDRIEELNRLIGKERLILDLSCRKRPSSNDKDDKNADSPYYIVTNRWQTFSDEIIDQDLLQTLSKYCCEFLIHAVDVEGKQSGIQQDLVTLLGDLLSASSSDPNDETYVVPITYAGGVRSIEDLELIHKLGKGKIDVTVGSALDIFGGPLKYTDVVRWHKEHNQD